MTDVMDLALKYGGFTTLDKVYLTSILENLSTKDQLAFVTPPPSVVNAYFAELYQKQGEKVATDYYLELTKAFNWWQKNPSFTAETKPFVRLNLSGKSFGFAYETDEVAQVFSEKKELITQSLLLEVAKIFPHYKIYQEENKIYMRPLEFDESDKEVLASDSESLLTDVARLKGDVLKISGYNEQEVLEVAQNVLAKRTGKRYYAFSQREFVIYSVQD